MGESRFTNLSRATSLRASSSLIVFKRLAILGLFLLLVPGCSLIFGSSKPSLGDANEFVGKLAWPVKRHQVLSGFGKRGWFSSHDGLDIKGAAGERIFAAHSGIVTYSGGGSGMTGYGNVVIIRSGALATLYAHNQNNLVRRGQRVDRGQHIANVGMTGNASGPHLHFETRIITGPKDFLVVNPMDFYSKE